LLERDEFELFNLSLAKFVQLTVASNRKLYRHPQYHDNDFNGAGFLGKGLRLGFVARGTRWFLAQQAHRIMTNIFASLTTRLDQMTIQPDLHQSVLLGKEKLLFEESNPASFFRL